MVQKGGIAGILGCMENTGVVSQLLKEAKTNKGNLTVLWLDLKNAFGSILHKPVEVTLESFCVHDRISDLILDYYNTFKMRTISKGSISAWHNLERGIITGCTISATLFTLAMKLIIRTAELECRGSVTRSGLRQPPIRAYVDDMTLQPQSAQNGF